MMEERGRGGVVQDFQTGGSDPAKQVISGRVRGNESVLGWVVSIEVSKDKSVRGAWKDVRIEGPGQGCIETTKPIQQQQQSWWHISNLFHISVHKAL